MKMLTRKLVTLALSALAAAALSTAAATFAHAAPPRATPAAKAVPATTTGVVNLNTASEAELERLPGIGPAKAAAIVAYRQKHGPFRRVEDLRRVKGFGRKTLLRLRPYLAVAGPTTLTEEVKAARAEESVDAQP